MLNECNKPYSLIRINGQDRVYSYIRTVFIEFESEKIAPI